MPLYEKDKSFSFGWVIGGCVIMFGTNILAGVALGLAGINSVGAFALAGLIAFGFGGFIIGLKSAGQTILEAGLAAAIAAVVAVGVQFTLLHRPINPVALLVGALVPFVAGLVGGWIGEKVQGDPKEETY